MRHTELLTALLATAGLGGADPASTAGALLARLAAQPGEADHHAAHNAMVVSAIRRMPLDSARATLADAQPDHARMVLARLVVAGVPEREILEYLPLRQTA